MNGSTVSVAPQSNLNVVGGQNQTPSGINALRIGAIADKFASSGQVIDGAQFIHLCLSLARGIDYAVSNNEIPSTAPDLPPIVKQVFQRRKEYHLQASVMVLMVSVKNACKIGWFTGKEKEDLLSLADEVAVNFSTEGNIVTEPKTVMPTVWSIMSKFYPRFKLGHVLLSLEIQPGYGAYAVDFHIPKGLSYTPQEKIRLFVAQKDNADTSSCLIRPPLVNFLLNGIAVNDRTNVSPQERGPQRPTLVNQLKKGTNLLQAVGPFDGHYIVLIALMSLIPSAELSIPQDYSQPAAPTIESDSEIIEGPSRISLNCPISCKRIQMPVKGHLCKHHQCFDLTDYILLNSKVPSWRCPHCNQSVCYTDIRIDQKMVKILKEVEENVVEVIINADGTWKAAPMMEGGQGDLYDKGHSGPLKENGRQSSPVPVDLTEVDDEWQEIHSSNIFDRKPLVHAGPQSSSASVIPVVPLVSRNAPEVTRNSIGPEATVRANTSLLNQPSVNYNIRSDAQTVHGAPATFVPSPVLTDAVSRALDQVATVLPGFDGSVTSTQFRGMTNPQLQHLQSFGNNESGFRPSSGDITRIPVANQAIQVPLQTEYPQHLCRPSLNNVAPNGPNVSFQSSASLASVPNVGTVHADPGRQRHILQSTSPRNDSRQSPLSQTQSASQVRGHTKPIQLPSAYGVSSGIRSDQQQLPLNQRMPQTVRQAAPHLMRSAHGLSTQNHRGSAVGSRHTTDTAQQMRVMNAAALQASQRSTQTTRQPPTVPLNLPTSRSAASMAAPTPMDIDRFRTAVAGQRGNAGNTPSPQAVSRTENLIDLQSENWRPSGRMRGSLSGRAYSEALSQFIIQPASPTLPTQTPSRPLSNLTTVPSEVQGSAANT